MRYRRTSVCENSIQGVLLSQFFEALKRLLPPSNALQSNRYFSASMAYNIGTYITLYSISIKFSFHQTSSQGN